MSRIAETFSKLAAQGRKALIPYITAGDPDPSITVDVMHSLVEGGADIIELGVPFSDPMADGPVIQHACERALAKGVSPIHVFDMVRTFRQKDATTPVVLMGYLNPVEHMGYPTFADKASDAGVDGILLVDMPPEEAAEPAEIFQARGIDPIFLLAPTSPEDRIKRICALASGYVYYVSLKGVTGSANLDVDAVEKKVAEIREHTRVPIGVGFGISTPETAAAVSKVSDGVIVGSVLVRQLEASNDDPASAPAKLESMISSMRKAMDNEIN
ncbi:tryptophan synthase subunit alpha [Pelagibaculum spongiae]|uniref:Tryptophan synthase alpha chain n=1 Tax=Pelagibaculum spongiae TaxID=2080658 RepID=A0A2V1GZ14_9GAMM|nr:tryptophan synthase subunit alpha [Pelagibaculum spongiae]PVZ71689.1 tryptophan synthase subunit alpha [Pelagibaculum spongiae]